MKTILLLSGGLDSVTLLYHLHQTQEVHCLLVNYQSKHNDHELSCARLHCGRLRLEFTTMTIPDLGGLTHKCWIVPNRNSVLLSLGVNLAIREYSQTVSIGCNADDALYPFPDCTKPFIKSFNSMIEASGSSVKVVAPFIDFPKWKIAGLSRELGVVPSEIWTCYQPTKSGPCGKCAACKNLKKAFK